MLELFSKQTKSSPTIFSWFKSAKNTTKPFVTSLTTAGNHKVGFEDVLYILDESSYDRRSVEDRRDVVLRNVVETSDRTTHIYSYKNKPIFWLISTLPPNEQEYIIPQTIPYHTEEKLINDVLNDLSIQPCQYYIVLYGKHSTDDTVDKKYQQLIHLGFTNVFIYYGGLFEWLLLQDIFSKEHFPTEKQTNKQSSDIIRDLLSMGAPSKFAAII